MTKTDNALTCPLLEATLGIDSRALHVGPHIIRARPEGDVERTRESDGKASAVHFIHFDLNSAAVADWKSGEGTVMLVIDHAQYGHAALISNDTRQFLANDCF